MYHIRADTQIMSKSFLLILLLFTSVLLNSQEVLRGQVTVELVPVVGGYMDVRYPLGTEEAHRRALEEAAYYFSAQIYGWAFHYDIGERARGIAEEFELTPLGEIRWGDASLEVTHAHLENSTLSVWMDYRPKEYQHRRLEMWRVGNIRTAQGIGEGPLGSPFEVSDWFDFKKAAMEDAARAAIRAMLQAQERNRPKEVRGLISLESFPNYHIGAGRWAAQALFRVLIEEIIPFAAH